MPGSFVESLLKLKDTQEFTIYAEEILESDELPIWCHNAPIVLQTWVEKVFQDGDILCGNTMARLLQRYLTVFSTEEADSIVPVFLQLNNLVDLTAKWKSSDVLLNVTFWESVSDLFSSLLLPSSCLLSVHFADVCVPFYHSAVDSSLEFFLRHIRLKALNLALESTSDEQKKNFRELNPKCIERLLQSLADIGDFDAQTSLVEATFRLSSPAERSRSVSLWLPNAKLSVKQLFVRIEDFDPDCRKFLNAFNDSRGTDRNVFTYPCLLARIGDFILQKPNSPTYEHLWADFNMGSDTISLLFDRSMQITDDPSMRVWETIIVYSHEVESVSLFCGPAKVRLEVNLSREPIDFFASPPTEHDASLLKKFLHIEFDVAVVRDADEIERICRSLYSSKFQVKRNLSTKTSVSEAVIEENKKTLPNYEGNSESVCPSDYELPTTESEIITRGGLTTPTQSDRLPGRFKSSLPSVTEVFVSAVICSNADEESAEERKSCEDRSPIFSKSPNMSTSTDFRTPTPSRVISNKNLGSGNEDLYSSVSSRSIDLSVVEEADCDPGKEVETVLRKDAKGVPRKGAKGVPRKGAKGVPRKEANCVPRKEANGVPRKEAKDVLKEVKNVPRKEAKCVPKDTEGFLKLEAIGVAGKEREDVPRKEAKGVPRKCAKGVPRKGAKGVPKKVKGVPRKEAIGVPKEETKNIPREEAKCVPRKESETSLREEEDSAQESNDSPPSASLEVLVGTEPCDKREILTTVVHHTPEDDDVDVESDNEIIPSSLDKEDSKSSYSVLSAKPIANILSKSIYCKNILETSEDQTSMREFVPESEEVPETREIQTQKEVEPLKIDDQLRKEDEFNELEKQLKEMDAMQSPKKRVSASGRDSNCSERNLDKESSNRNMKELVEQENEICVVDEDTDVQQLELVDKEDQGKDNGNSMGCVSYADRDVAIDTYVIGLNETVETKNGNHVIYQNDEMALVLKDTSQIKLIQTGPIDDKVTDDMNVYFDMNDDGHIKRNHKTSTPIKPSMGKEEATLMTEENTYNNEISENQEVVQEMESEKHDQNENEPMDTGGLEYSELITDLNSKTLKVVVEKIDENDAITSVQNESAIITDLYSPKAKKNMKADASFKVLADYPVKMPCQDTPSRRNETEKKAAQNLQASIKRVRTPKIKAKSLPDHYHRTSTPSYYLEFTKKMGRKSKRKLFSEKDTVFDDSPPADESLGIKKIMPQSPHDPVLETPASPPNKKTASVSPSSEDSCDRNSNHRKPQDAHKSVYSDFSSESPESDWITGRRKLLKHVNKTYPAKRRKFEYKQVSSDEEYIPTKQKICYMNARPYDPRSSTDSTGFNLFKSPARPPVENETRKYFTRRAARKMNENLENKLSETKNKKVVKKSRAKPNINKRNEISRADKPDGKTQTKSFAKKVQEINSSPELIRNVSHNREESMDGWNSFCAGLNSNKRKFDDKEIHSDSSKDLGTANYSLDVQVFSPKRSKMSSNNIKDIKKSVESVVPVVSRNEYKPNYDDSILINPPNNTPVSFETSAPNDLGIHGDIQGTFTKSRFTYASKNDQSMFADQGVKRKTETPFDQYSYRVSSPDFGEGLEQPEFTSKDGQGYSKESDFHSFGDDMIPTRPNSDESTSDDNEGPRSPKIRMKITKTRSNDKYCFASSLRNQRNDDSLSPIIPASLEIPPTCSTQNDYQPPSQFCPSPEASNDGSSVVQESSDSMPEDSEKTSMATASTKIVDVPTNTEVDPIQGGSTLLNFVSSVGKFISNSLTPRSRRKGALFTPKKLSPRTLFRSSAGRTGQDETTSNSQDWCQIPASTMSLLVNELDVLGAEHLEMSRRMFVLRDLLNSTLSRD